VRWSGRSFHSVQARRPLTLSNDSIYPYATPRKFALSWIMPMPKCHAQHDMLGKGTATFSRHTETQAAVLVSCSFFQPTDRPAWYLCWFAAAVRAQQVHAWRSRSTARLSFVYGAVAPYHQLRSASADLRGIRSPASYDSTRYGVPTMPCHDRAQRSVRTAHLTPVSTTNAGQNRFR